MKTETKSFWLPTIPYSPIDMINRRAAASGSVTFAQQTAYADYNGHHVSVSFKPHAVSGPTWNCEYWWGGRVVLGRGSLARCLEAAVAEFKRGALGTMVAVSVHEEAPESVEEQTRLITEAGFEPHPGNKDTIAHFWTDKHANVQDAMSRSNTGFGRIDYGSKLIQRALKFEGTKEEWATARDEFLGWVNCAVEGCTTKWIPRTKEERKKTTCGSRLHEKGAAV